LATLLDNSAASTLLNPAPANPGLPSSGGDAGLPAPDGGSDPLEHNPHVSQGAMPADDGTGGHSSDTGGVATSTTYPLPWVEAHASVAAANRFAHLDTLSSFGLRNGLGAST
jgi:hypothetical protein